MWFRRKAICVNNENNVALFVTQHRCCLVELRIIEKYWVQLKSNVFSFIKIPLFRDGSVCKAIQLLGLCWSPIICKLQSCKFEHLSTKWQMLTCTAKISWDYNILCNTVRYVITYGGTTSFYERVNKLINFLFLGYVSNFYLSLWWMQNTNRGVITFRVCSQNLILVNLKFFLWVIGNNYLRNPSLAFFFSFET